MDTITSNNVTISGHTWTPAASVTPVHDFDGNLTFDGRWNYSWDAENRNTRMETTAAAATAGVPRQRLDFVYDSEGRRVAKTVSTSTDGSNWTLTQDLRFLYDGWNLIAEYEMYHLVGGNYLLLQATHTWGIDLSGTPQGAGGVGGLLCSTLTHSDWSTHPYFPAFDGNGNVSAWVGENGSLLGRMDYSPFGQLIAQYKFTQPADTSLSRLPFGFSTKYTDKESGLLYYGYRYYDPVTGRWISRDPIEEEGGINLHGFVGNDGVKGSDYLGLDNINHHKVGSLLYQVVERAGIDPNEYTVGAHGSRTHIKGPNDVGSMLAAALALKIKADPKYDPKKPVRLNSCLTGAPLPNGEENFAQQLANELDNDVIAPTSTITRTAIVISFPFTSKMVVPSAPKTAVENGGHWEIFKCKKK